MGEANIIYRRCVTNPGCLRSCAWCGQGRPRLFAYSAARHGRPDFPTNPKLFCNVSCYATYNDVNTADYYIHTENQEVRMKRDY